MQVIRPATLALLAVCAATALASGCRTAGVNDLARPDPVPVPRSTAVASEILAEHNRNAERIQVMVARSDLTATVNDPERRGRSESHPLSARLALVQPRNFKLELVHTSGKVGDIGSNDKEYWFWVKDKTQKVIYYCNYDDAAASSQAATMQPDWIKEAMGLRVIPESEASQIKVSTGSPGTLVLTHRPHRAGDGTYTRVTVVDQASHKILEHQLRAADQKTILARAEVPDGYMDVPDSSEASDSIETVSIPRRLKLTWVQEGLELDVTFRPDVKVNLPPKQAPRPELFVEPPLKGYSRFNLGAPSRTTVRETRPAPPTGSGIRLGAPAPIGDDAASRDVRGRGDIDPIGLGGAEPTVPSLADQVVGARYPTAPEF